MTGGRIRRGSMAGDQFTQIANGLFRDSRLSYKAKGIFGYISTHQDGWQVTVAGLVRTGPDGRDAVRTGLKELETHGYLIRERLRRTNGTLGEIVYSITDHPTFVDALMAEAATALHAPSAPRDGRGDYGMGIRRGVMAGDQFTQIANGLFRDSRMSFKSKGLFGLISTHREGWHLTVADLTRRGREGVDAVTTGLEELESYGFLQRDRDRNPDGTLGSATYFITDLPALQNTTSQPESGNPGLDNPTLADRPTKNTIVKKTNKQKTSSVPPCAHGERTSDRPAVPPQRTAAPTPQDLDPGTRLLLSIGSAHPELLLQEKALYDQGRIMTGMLDARLELRAAAPHHHQPPAAEHYSDLRRRDRRRPTALRTELPAARHRGRPLRHARLGRPAAAIGQLRRSHTHSRRSPGLPGPCRMRRVRRSRNRPRRRPLPGLPRLALVPHLPRTHPPARPPQQ